MDDLILKIITTLGVPGLTIYLFYRLVDRHVAKFAEQLTRFVDASAKQSVATAELVETVRSAGGEQRDVLLAIRAMAREVAELKGWVKEVETAK